MATGCVQAQMLCSWYPRQLHLLLIDLSLYMTWQKFLARTPSRSVVRASIVSACPPQMASSADGADVADATNVAELFRQLDQLHSEAYR